jgi:hypothetical protein
MFPKSWNRMWHIAELIQILFSQFFVRLKSSILTISSIVKNVFLQFSNGKMMLNFELIGISQNNFGLFEKIFIAAAAVV